MRAPSGATRPVAREDHRADAVVLLEIGDEVFAKHLATQIYPESRALVEAHQAMGHTVAIVSSATRYQAEPLAKDMNIPHVLCTRPVNTPSN